MGRHSLQSPFLFDLYKNVIQREPQALFPQYEAVRRKLKSSSVKISVTDFGAGSIRSNSETRKVSDIANYGVSKRRYSEILYRLARYLKCRHVVELGTSLGLNTLYLAHEGATKVATFEGAQSLATLASENFRAFDKKNIEIVTGNIDETFTNYLSDHKDVDLYFFDANHRYEPTIAYFETALSHSHEQSCFVFDDIHLSKEMERAWQAIKTHPRTSLSIDLYQIGIVFINSGLTNQHYVLEA